MNDDVPYSMARQSAAVQSAAFWNSAATRAYAECSRLEAENKALRQELEEVKLARDTAQQFLNAALSANER